MKKNNIIIKYLCLSTLLLIYVSSCVNVELTDENNLNTNLPYQVQVKFDTDSIPYTTSVVMKRIINNWNYIHTNSINAEGKYDKDIYNFDITEGTYRIYAFAYTPESVYPVARSIENLGAEELTGNANNIDIKYCTFDRRSYGNGAGSVDWVDFNGYSYYVRTWREPILVDSTNFMEINSPSSKPYVMTPKPVTQKLNFRISIDKNIEKTPFVVDSVVCEISGIVAGMNLGTRSLDISKTYKTTFRAFPSNSSGVKIKDTDTNTKVNVAGSVRVLGLVCSNDNRRTTGPGILQLVIYTHSSSGETEKHNYIQAITNMHDAIYNSKLTYTNEDGQLVQVPGEYTLTIKNPLNIDGDAVLSPGGGISEGEQWISGPDTDLDI